MTLTGVLMLMATGPTPMTVGHGFLMKISAGQPTITGAGLTWLITAGSGFPAAIWIGGRLGFPGEPVAITLAGRPCRRAGRELFIQEGLSALAWTSSSISVRPITILSMLVLSVSPSCATVFSRRHRMFPISIKQ